MKPEKLKELKEKIKAAKAEVAALLKAEAAAEKVCDKASIAVNKAIARRDKLLQKLPADSV